MARTFDARLAVGFGLVALGGAGAVMLALALAEPDATPTAIVAPPASVAPVASSACDECDAHVRYDDEYLDKATIAAGLSPIMPAVAACYVQYGAHGVARVEVVIERDGTVSAAKPLAKFAKTPMGACIELAVKHAKFPRHWGGPETFYYPFILR